MMIFKDLRQYIKLLEDKGQVIHVKESLSLDLEIPSFLRKLMYIKGPVAIFENIVEKTLPVVGNLFNDERIALIMNGEDPARRVSKIENLLTIKPSRNVVDMIRSLRELKKHIKYFPKIVKSGSVHEIEWREVDLTRLPGIRQWPLEPGRFLTFGITFTRYRGTTNFGYYRLQIIGKDRLIMHWMPWRRSREYSENVEKCEVAIVFGPEPVTMLMAGVPIPHPLDKVLIAGLVRGEGLELVKGVIVDIEYPAHAELVLEGYVEKITALEGPFGDHAGMYSISTYYPVVKVTKILSRDEPIVPVTVTGKPTLEDGYIMHFGERVVLPLLKQLIPELVDIHIPPEGVGYLAVVSIRKKYPGQAKRVMMMLWSMVPLLSKIVIVVDHDVNVRNWSQVIYALSINVNPQRDLLIIPNYPTEELDPSTPTPGYGSKVGIDATRKLPEEYDGKEYPKDVECIEEVERKINEILRKYLIH